MYAYWVLFVGGSTRGDVYRLRWAGYLLTGGCWELLVGGVGGGAEGEGPAPAEQPGPAAALGAVSPSAPGRYLAIARARVHVAILGLSLVRAGCTAVCRVGSRGAAALDRHATATAHGARGPFAPFANDAIDGATEAVAG